MIVNIDWKPQGNSLCPEHNTPVLEEPSDPNRLLDRLAAYEFVEPPKFLDRSIADKSTVQADLF